MSRHAIMSFNNNEARMDLVLHYVYTITVTRQNTSTTKGQIDTVLTVTMLQVHHTQIWQD